MIDVSKATTGELVNYYNAHSGKSPIKKFADRKTAERRVAALVPSKKDQSSKKKTGNGHVRTKVMVGGVEYRSTKAAFEALKLPLGSHIAFRMKLKAAGKLTFDDKHEFKVV